MIYFCCLKCGTRLSADPSRIGQAVLCAKCKAQMTVPKPPIAVRVDMPGTTASQPAPPRTPLPDWLIVLLDSDTVYWLVQGWREPVNAVAIVLLLAALGLGGIGLLLKSDVKPVAPAVPLVHNAPEKTPTTQAMKTPVPTTQPTKGPVRLTQETRRRLFGCTREEVRLMLGEPSVRIDMTPAPARVYEGPGAALRYQRDMQMAVFGSRSESEEENWIYNYDINNPRTTELQFAVLFHHGKVTSVSAP